MSSFFAGCRIRTWPALYDLRAIRQGAYPDPEVYANDVVLVGDSQARRLFKDLLQALRRTGHPP